MYTDDKQKAARLTPEELPFKSIFDPRGPPPPDSELWVIPEKDFDVSKFGPVLYSSKLRKRSKQVGIYISRIYFLFEKYLAYGTSTNPAKIRKYMEIEGLKVRIESHKSKTKATQQKYSLTLYRLKMSVELVTRHKDVIDGWRQHLSKTCIMLNFSEFYETKEILGKGAHGKVVLAQNKEGDGKYAVKVFEKVKTLTQFRGWQNLATEVQILRTVTHKDVIRLHEVYESETEVHLVLQYVDGGDLQSKIRRKGMYSERNAITLIRNILEVLVYLHGKGWVHRDIKPANVVLSSKESETEIKVIDFGFAMDIKMCKDLNLRCGTPGYVAPEVLNPSLTYPITEKVDIFSVGTIFYQVLTGTKLFQGRSNRQVLTANKRCVIDVTKLAKKNISNHTLDLLLRMLERNPAKRISAAEALEHCLFTHYVASSAEILDDGEILAVAQTTKYSFDMVSLKERNISSHSRIIDTHGTFYVIPCISIDALETSGKPGKIKNTPNSSRKGSGNSSDVSKGSRGNLRGLSPESWDESLDEEYKSLERKSKESSFDGEKKIQRKSTYSGGQSPIHKVAIMNNLKKAIRDKEDGPEDVDEGMRGDSVMQSFDLLGISTKQRLARGKSLSGS